MYFLKNSIDSKKNSRNSKNSKEMLKNQRGEIERPPHLKNRVGGRATVLNSTTPLYCPTLTLASNFSIFYKITLKLDLDKLQLIFKSNDFAYPHQVIKIAPIKRKWPI